MPLDGERRPRWCVCSAKLQGFITNQSRVGFPSLAKGRRTAQELSRGIPRRPVSAFGAGMACARRQASCLSGGSCPQLAGRALVAFQALARLPLVGYLPGGGRSTWHMQVAQGR